MIFLLNVEVVDMEITAYAPLDPKAIEGVCYSGDPTITASGNKVVIGRTVASGRNLPFGTLVFIKGFGFRIVEDRGGKIKSHNLDIAVQTKAEAWQIGRQERRVIIFNNKRG